MSGLSYEDLKNKSLFGSDGTKGALQQSMDSMKTMQSLKPQEARQSLIQSNHNITNPTELGAGLLVQRMDNNSGSATSQPSFDTSYNSLIGANHDKAQLSRNLQEYKNVDIDVFPPLLIKYKTEPAYPDGRFLPLVVRMGGELQPAEEGVPDIVLNFHNPSGAITISVFPVKNANFHNLKLAMNVFYAMKSPEPVDAQKFIEIYRDTRTRLLNVASGYQ